VHPVLTPCSPVAFDPSSFYGHDEFDLAIAGMFGGFSQAFYSAYHSSIPKAPGFIDRHQLYLLFHNLNHWYELTFGICNVECVMLGFSFPAGTTSDPVTGQEQFL